jgi:hypothetical protein
MRGHVDTRSRVLEISGGSLLAYLVLGRHRSTPMFATSSSSGVLVPHDSGGCTLVAWPMNCARVSGLCASCR